jgi:tetratricopeptide (TPR) repeat protein
VGNALCERCHATGLQNAPLIDSEAHTHHDEGNAGRECVGCHMPRTIYMQRHPRRDHGFTIPDPVLTTELGVPNACNRCHADRDARWVVEQTEKWYAPKRTLRARDRARLLARARVGERSSIAPLKTMLDEDTQPFWRASAASLLGGFLNDEEARSALHDALVDDSALVRAHAAQALEPLAQGGDPATVRKIRPLLEDAARDVRIAAAMALRGVRGPGVEARADVMTFLEHNADQPQGRLQLSMYDLSRGDHRAALGHIEQALVWDRAAVPLLQQKAVVLSALGRGAEAVSALEDAIALEPDSARLHYLLGLACNEVKEEQRAIDELQRAVELDPMLGRAWYNLGLALHAADETRRALRALEQAQTALPDDPRPSYARATIHYQQGDLEAAAKAAEEALRIFPDFAEARSLVQSLRARRTEDEDSGGPRSRTN